MPWFSKSRGETAAWLPTPTPSPIARADNPWRDMNIRRRHRCFGLHVTINFKTEEWLAKGIPKHVPVRLYFNEDCDLSDRVPNPEWLPEVDESEEQ